jgi:hypothetical protein
MPPAWIVKRVLLGPEPVRRVAARRSTDRTERWMLLQSAAVRQSYVEKVLGRGGSDDLEQAWMLLQPEEVRRSYVEEVLGVEP